MIKLLKIKIKEFAKQYGINLARIVFGIISGVLLLLGLYQLEVLMILNCQIVDYWFELPFGYHVPWWFARDLFYLSIVLGYVVLIFALELDRLIKLIKRKR